MVFRDVSWIKERTNGWDAIGVISYALIFTFAESIIIFGVVTFLGFFTPGQWKVDKRITFLSLLFLLTSLWAIIAQLLFLWNISLPVFAIRFIAHSAHPLRILYAGVLVIVIPSILLPVILFMKSDKAVLFMKDLIERLTFLSMFYLFFDVVGGIIVIFRNLA